MILEVLIPDRSIDSGFGKGKIESVVNTEIKEIKKIRSYDILYSVYSEC